MCVFSLAIGYREPLSPSSGPTYRKRAPSMRGTTPLSQGNAVGSQSPVHTRRQRARAQKSIGPASIPRPVVFPTARLCSISIAQYPLLMTPDARFFVQGGGRALDWIGFGRGLGFQPLSSPAHFRTMQRIAAFATPMPQVEHWFDCLLWCDVGNARCVSFQGWSWD